MTTMRQRWSVLVAVGSLVAFGAGGTAGAALTLPERPEGPVSDYARALDATSRQRLESAIAQATQGRTLQYAIAIFPSLEGEAIEDASMRLAERWKIGGKKDSDGVLLTVFLGDRKLRIEVGYGLEGRLTDVQSARIIREVMTPRLRTGDLGGALLEGIAAINQAAGGNPIAGVAPRPLGRATQPERPMKKIPGWVLLLVFAGVILVVGAVSARPRRLGRRGGWPGGWLGGSGGWGSGFGGGGGGGGGFSGGGGSFGGGGASGSW